MFLTNNSQIFVFQLYALRSKDTSRCRHVSVVKTVKHLYERNYWWNIRQFIEFRLLLYRFVNSL